MLFTWSQIHPGIFSLGCFTGCASETTPLGASTFCGLAGLHYILEKNY